MKEVIFSRFKLINVLRDVVKHLSELKVSEVHLDVKKGRVYYIGTLKYEEK